MTRLIIDERDLRCTILEGIRTGDPLLDTESFAKSIADAVVACGDPVGTPSGDTFTLAQLEELQAKLDDGSEWETVNEFWLAWGPRTSPRISTVLRTAIRACQALATARADPLADACPICENGHREDTGTEPAMRWSCGHWIKKRPRIHVDCFRMPGGTAPCACLDGCGACDSCGLWIGDTKHQPRIDRRARTLIGCSCGFACTNETQLSEHMAAVAALGELTVQLGPDEEPQR